MFKLDTQSRTPIYEQLKAQITELVVIGALEPGSQLPSVRSLARDLGVNPNTVQKAYQDLERDQVIYSVSGKGSFIASRPFPQEDSAPVFGPSKAGRPGCDEQRDAVGRSRRNGADGV